MKTKPLSKHQIQEAHKRTRSNRAAARFLNCSYRHYKAYAKLYIDEETGKSLFDLHLNQAGKGIPKYLVGKKKDPALEQLFSGLLDPAHFSPEKIKNRLILENYIAEECNFCKLNERRVIDYKMPLLLNFKDKNKNNYRLENLELLCYNCYFLHIGDVFNKEQEDSIQSSVVMTKSNQVKWELEDDLLENMKAMGISI